MSRFATTQLSLSDAINTVADKADYLQTRAVNAVTSNNPTLTAAQMVNAIVTLSGQTGAQTVTTPTATALIALIPDVQVGHTFEFIVQNGHTSSGTATISPGSGVTVTNTYATAAQPITTTRIYRAVVTNVATPAVTIYPIGQVA